MTLSFPDHVAARTSATTMAEVIPLRGLGLPHHGLQLAGPGPLPRPEISRGILPSSGHSFAFGLLKFFLPHPTSPRRWTYRATTRVDADDPSLSISLSHISQHPHSIPNSFVLGSASSPLLSSSRPTYPTLILRRYELYSGQSRSRRISVPFFLFFQASSLTSHPSRLHPIPPFS